MFRSASLFIGTYFTVTVFTIFATSNVDSIVGIPHKIYSMQKNLIHIKKANLFVKCAHMHPGYAANLVDRNRYYYCHWTVLINQLITDKWKKINQSHERHVVPNHRWLDCLFTTFIGLTKIRARHFWCFVGETHRWPVVGGTHRWLMDSPHKEAVMQKACPCHGV